MAYIKKHVRVLKRIFAFTLLEGKFEDMRE